MDSTLTDGATITYVREDAGQILDSGLYLQPGEILTVGTDLPLALAERLVEDHVCSIVPPAAKSGTASGTPIALGPPPTGDATSAEKAADKGDGPESDKA